MPRKVTDFCDVPGCENNIVQTSRAGSGMDWGRREVRDYIKKDLLAGVQEFEARVVFNLCPAHVNNPELVPLPKVHPEIVEFMEQAEKDKLEREKKKETENPLPS